MRVAVVSDVHGNLHALEAVLDAVAAETPDAVWCLGDLVGYGPQPNQCCTRIADLADLCLVGNHDLAALGRVDLSIFTHDAGAAVRWTSATLDETSRAFLEPLEPHAEAEGVGLYHASPRDPVWEYVLSAEAALAAFLSTQWKLILVGHSHVALALSFTGSAIEGGLAAGDTELELGADRRWLLNPGSVGQPRDGDPRAAFLLLDLERRHAEFRRIEYPIELTQADIRAHGLPEGLAARLEHGI